jgi:hypothetical protein
MDVTNLANARALSWQRHKPSSFLVGVGLGMTRLGRTLAAGCVKSRPVVGDGGSGRLRDPRFV